jgi:hypothetical protein
MHPDISTMTWQGFILLNLVALIGLAYWTGRQAEKIEDLQERVKKLEDNPQAVPVARIEERLEAMAATLMALSADFRGLQTAIYHRDGQR